jgi:transposase IS481 family protein
MPWQEVVTVELRQQFIHDARRRVIPIAELCAGYGISRKTGYKFLARYDALGAAGLVDQSRRPHRSPTALDPALLQRLLEAHHRHPYWGPRKLLRLVGQRWPDAPWPGALHRRPLLPALGAGHCPPTRPPPRLGGPARRPDGRAQCRVDHRLQGPVQARGCAVLLPAHGRRRLQSDAARLPGAHQHQAGRGAARLRAALPRVWSAPADPLG